MSESVTSCQDCGKIAQASDSKKIPNSNNLLYENHNQPEFGARYVLCLIYFMSLSIFEIIATDITYVKFEMRKRNTLTG